VSIKRIKKIECPECGHNREVVVWSSINVQFNPEAKEELLEGKINSFHCDNCGCKRIIPLALLYHDMEKQFCAQFFPFGTMDNGFFENFTENGDLDLRRTGVQDPPEYFGSAHIVFSMDELARYVIFREKLAQQKDVVNRGQAINEGKNGH